MTSHRLLLLHDLVPAAEALCSLLGVPCAVVSGKPAWDAPEHQLVQVDLPRLHARVFEEAAGQLGISVESLLTTWIGRCRAELTVEGSGPGPVERACRRMAEWDAMGYTGAEEAVRDLAREASRA